MRWLGIPIVTGNDGRDYIMIKHYDAARPTSRIWQELDAHKWDRNIAIADKRGEGESGIWSLMACAAIKNLATDLWSAIKNSHIRSSKFWYTNIPDWAVSEISVPNA